MIDHKLVSVIMPAFNSASFISEAMESVIQQTYPHWELIVVDDGSTDETREIVQAYRQMDGRIRYIHQDNSGPAAARNRGIQTSRGTYIAFLDSDDVWFFDKLEKQMDFAISHPGYVVYGGARYLWEKNGRFVKDRDIKTFRNFDTIQENLEYFLFHPNLTITSTVLLEKSMLDMVKPFDESLESSEDDNLFFCLAMHYKFFALNEPVFYRRRHAKNVTKKISFQEGIRNRFRAVQKFVREAPPELLPTGKSKILSYWAFVFSTQFYEKSMYADSVAWFLKGLIIDPAYYFTRFERKIRKLC